MITLLKCYRLFNTNTASNLEQITLGNGCTNIPESFALNQSKLTTVNNSSVVQNIKSSAFKGCLKLESFDFSNINNEISAYAFYQNESLKKIEILGNVIKVGDRCFEGCKKVEYLYVSKDVKTLGSYCFNFGYVLGLFRRRLSFFEFNYSTDIGLEGLNASSTFVTYWNIKKIIQINQMKVVLFNDTFDAIICDVACEDSEITVSAFTINDEGNVYNVSELGRNSIFNTAAMKITLRNLNANSYPINGASNLKYLILDNILTIKSGIIDGINEELYIYCSYETAPEDWYVKWYGSVNPNNIVWGSVNPPIS
ncbi:MAG: leucine-rich repeat domain-containing protein [Bacilli bacterium]|nr:leucine-rich repeat domain-containing protein [Bacilli bacterium]MBR1582001.1 leucine-rich repeat domain-containing protein [Bacilli bacterium]